MRVAETIELDATTERELRALSKRRRIEARLQQRAQVILLAAQGWQNKEIALEVRSRPAPGGLVAPSIPARWRRRVAPGCAALGPHAHRHGRGGVADRRGDLAHQAGSGHALEHAHAGRAPGTGRRPPSAASGKATASSRIWRAPSSSRATRASRRSCWTSWGCT